MLAYSWAGRIAAGVLVSFAELHVIMPACFEVCEKGRH